MIHTVEFRMVCQLHVCISKFLWELSFCVGELASRPGWVCASTRLCLRCIHILKTTNTPRPCYSILTGFKYQCSQQQNRDNRRQGAGSFKCHVSDARRYSAERLTLFPVLRISHLLFVFFRQEILLCFVSCCSIKHIFMSNVDEGAELLTRVAQMP